MGHEGQIHLGFLHSCTFNSDIVGLRTFECLSVPADSWKPGCYGKPTSRASERTETLTFASSHTVPRLVIGSAGGRVPQHFDVCQMIGLSSPGIKAV